ncbi:hypothetical protein GUJ93_ZPchr0002g25924 [Zizania palustris]|uniref:Uncharacterized protein n=1 Tax=Zizania palustris TaxID=103762 RepID=A0A8J5V583_ZIZPA|nr:hypothetical protein GUJ93_ZPchr0002g25924 [Zizania palustris]
MTPGTGTSTKQIVERWTKGVPCLAARKAGTEEPAAMGTVTWDRIRRRAAKEEGDKTQTSRRTARAEGSRALSRRRTTREEGGGTFTEPPPTVTAARGTCRRATGEGGAKTLAGPP